MTRSELIKQLGQDFPHVAEENVESMVNLILEDITQALVQKKRAEFRSFGAFTVRRRKERLGRNPRTGANVNVDEKNFPFFKCGRTLLSQLNRW